MSRSALHRKPRPLNFRLQPTILAALLLLLAGTLASAQTVTTIFNFKGGSTSGANPWYVTLVQGTDGNLYGTTYGGGSSKMGTAFNVTTSGTQTLLHTFKGGASDGANPTGGLTLGSDGNFYGTTQQGGSSSQGVVFKMTTTGTVTVLHSFNSGVDGAFPWGPPILASDGNFYGTTSGGGTGNGLVYKITSSGTYTTIYTFDVTHGFSPIASPVQGTDSFLYIPVALGGTSFCGTIIQLSTAGVLNNTFNFSCGSGGSFPIGPLVQASNGNFYSTTQDGGSNGEGIVYQITTALVATVLHNFGATFGDGIMPSAGLLLATDGNYYGSTAEGGSFDDGTLFNTSTSGTYTQLFSFNNSANLLQMSPLSPPVQHTNGTLFGVTEFGGTSNMGTVYSLNMGLAAFVNSPLFIGRSGSSVLILGNHLTGTTQVMFNGLPASFVVHDDTHLSATVPAGATSGWIKVVTPTGTLRSRKLFRIKS